MYSVYISVYINILHFIWFNMFTLFTCILLYCSRIKKKVQTHSLYIQVYKHHIVIYYIYTYIYSQLVLGRVVCERGYRERQTHEAIKFLIGTFPQTQLWMDADTPIDITDFFLLLDFYCI